ncbi:MAG: ubiquinone/menaquinone biosynthesis methyltransferase [Candidatus Eremiobacterota bacterium]
MRLTVRAMFGRIAPRYDLVNRWLSLGLDQGWRRRAVAALALSPGDPVVDLCCGTGDLTHALWLGVRPARVVGVDFAEPMLERARGKFPGLEFVHGDALAAPLDPGSFAAATVAFGLRNVEDLGALWREMMRLVRPGGRILSLELTRPPGFLGVLHGFYLRVVVPLVGGLLSGDPAAYGYLARTVSRFASVEEVCRSMQAAGLLEVRAIPLSGGIATLHVGVRP